MDELIDEAWARAEKRLNTKKEDGTHEIRSMRFVFKEELLKVLWKPVVIKEGKFDLNRFKEIMKATRKEDGTLK